MFVCIYLGALPPENATVWCSNVRAQRKTCGAPTKVRLARREGHQQHLTENGSQR